MNNGTLFDHSLFSLNKFRKECKSALDERAESIGRVFSPSRNVVPCQKYTNKNLIRPVISLRYENFSFIKNTRGLDKKRARLTEHMRIYVTKFLRYGFGTSNGTKEYFFHNYL